jgi:alcohol dehydrogenase class IV
MPSPASCDIRLGTVHGFASVIGARYDIPHGLVCGTLMAPANRVNVRELRIIDPGGQALRKYVRLGRLFLEKEGESDDYYIDGFINRIYELTTELNLPGFTGFGMDESDVEDICSETENKNNPVKLSNERLTEILRERL